MYLEYIKSAISSIRSNKGRSFLTMLGIIIGIAAVLTVLVIGDGMRASINSEMDSIGATTVTVSLDNTKTEKKITNEQFNAIADGIDGIYGLSPDIQLGGGISAVTPRKAYDMYITGETPASENSGSTKMVHGRFLSDADVADSKKVIVLSQSAAKAIFGYEEVVGQIVTIDFTRTVVDLVVIGIREDNTLDKMYSTFIEDPVLLANMPYTTFVELLQIDIDNFMTGFTIYLDSENKDAVLAHTRAVVENVLGLRGENAVKISSGYGFDETTNTILNIVTSVVAIIAAISLLVGGIGVMNIMTVSVTERTREIGIRKSLGARTSSILTQFLAEAAILTFTGGIIGIVFGLTVAYIICKVIDFSFVVNPVLVTIVVLIATAIGLFFGIYPAKRAARLDPIEALRTE